jgi:hypothetical protein
MDIWNEWSCSALFKGINTLFVGSEVNDFEHLQTLRLGGSAGEIPREGNMQYSLFSDSSLDSPPLIAFRPWSCIQQPAALGPRDKL